MGSEPGTTIGDGMELPELLILRHGETRWNRERRMQGNRDSALTELGRAQARAQGEILKALGVSGHAVISSPQGRALHTAELALDMDRGMIATDARLREIGIGHWAGRRLADIEAERPELFTGEPLAWYRHAPGGETLDQLAARADALLRELRQPTILITHGITSRVLRCRATGRSAGDFNRVEGGQGVVFRVRNGESERLDGGDGA